MKKFYYTIAALALLNLWAMNGTAETHASALLLGAISASAYLIALTIDEGEQNGY